MLQTHRWLLLAVVVSFLAADAAVANPGRRGRPIRTVPTVQTPAQNVQPGVTMMPPVSGMPYPYPVELQRWREWNLWLYPLRPPGVIPQPGFIQPPQSVPVSVPVYVPVYVPVRPVVPVAPVHLDSWYYRPPSVPLVPIPPQFPQPVLPWLPWAPSGRDPAQFPSAYRPPDPGPGFPESLIPYTTHHPMIVPVPLLPGTWIVGPPSTPIAYPPTWYPRPSSRWIGYVHWCS
jgi:hypothetical protein